tara:strand:- start:141 stop:416 length:276 start_codon:yes stop_codon:yes gene_type:complete
MRQYKIYNQVNSPDYKQPYSKSFGANGYTETKVFVGTSSRNSFEFLDHGTQLTYQDDGLMRFDFMIDGNIVKTALYNPKTKEINYSVSESI